MKFTNDSESITPKNSKLLEIAQQLVNLTVIEARQLAVILEQEHGILPSRTEVFTGPGENWTPVVDEQTEFDVVLKSASAQKLQVIKATKEILGLSLIEAKTLVDSVPCVFKAKISKEEAESIKHQLESLDAEVELK